MASDEVYAAAGGPINQRQRLRQAAVAGRRRWRRRHAGRLGHASHCHTTGEAVRSQCVGELPGSRIVRSIQTDVDVADDEDRVGERGYQVEHIRQLGEKG